MKEATAKRLSNYSFYIKHTLLPILVYGSGIGLITGAVIWGYSFAVEWLGEKSIRIYSFVQENPAFTPLLFAGLLLLATISWLNITATPEVSGSGVPYSEGVMRGLLPLRWLRTLLAMLTGSFISFFAGLPLGSEGPSVMIGGCIGKGVNEIGRKRYKSRHAWRRQSVTGGASAGFAVAFNAPLAGIIFALEEGHKRFSPMLLLPAASSVIVASVTANILTALTGHGIDNVVFSEFALAADPTFKEIGYLALLGIAMGLFSVLFSIFLNHFGNNVKRLKIHPWIKIASAFVLCGAVGLLLGDAIGGGAGLIRKIALMKLEWKLMLVLLAVKLVTVVFCSATGVTGGLFIPILAIGALFGGIMAKLLIYLGLDQSFYNTVVLISMCAFLGGVMRAPLTAIVLVVEMTNRLTASLWAACLVIVLSYFIIELFNVEPIYDNMLSKLTQKHFAGKKTKLVELEVEIEPGAFATGRCVRDILWPANTLVSKVKKTDADGHVIYKMDKDGERRIHVGDKFIIQAETADFEETYRQLSYIVKRPDYADTFPEDSALKELTDSPDKT